MTRQEFEELVEELEDLDSLGDLKQFCDDNGLEGYLDDYLSDDEALDYIKQYNCDSMERLYFCTREINDWNANYYHIDGYGNLENGQSLREIKQDIIKELEYNIN